MPDHRTDFAPDWAVLVDLARDVEVSEMDAQFLQASLQDAGIESEFYPCPPGEEVRLPYGISPPASLLVPTSALDEAREVFSDVLPEAASAVARREAAARVPHAATARPVTSAAMSPVAGRSSEQGGASAFLSGLLRMVLIAVAFAVVAGAIYGLARVAQGLIGG